MTKEELLKEIELKCFNKAGKLDGNFHNPKSKSHDAKLIEEINKLTTQFTNISLREQIHVLRNNITERPKCYCDNELEFRGFNQGYRDYCSTPCQRKSPTKKEKVDSTWKNKTKEEKDTHVRNNKESKLRNHGDPNYNNPKKIAETYKNKNQEYWDARNEKQFNTKLERYGDKHYCNGEQISDTWQNKTNEELVEIQEKKINTYLDNYGVEHPMLLESHKNKIKETWIDNYGVEHPMKSQEVKDKLQETKTTNGTLQNSPIVLAKAKETNIERYEAITFTASQEGKDQVFKTKLERYGDGNYCNGNKISESLLLKTDEEWLEITHKRLVSGVKTKTYTMPSGKEVLYQGYENFAIDILLKRFDEDDIDVHPDFVVKYIHNDKNRRYLPDIYVKSLNTIIEVKSTWTYEKDLEVNKLKEQACFACWL